MRRILAALMLLSCSAAALSADQHYAGYLTPGEFDVSTALEPAPRKGDPRFEADRAIFRATRALLGTPRGDLAARDVKTDPAAMMRAFSCAVGVTLTPDNAPAVSRVIDRAGIDTGAQNAAAKKVFKRRRPFIYDKGAICQPKADLDIYDYPSGHTARGWTWALLLAELAPDRAGPILARGRAFGESRFVCGAHNESAVEAGMASAGATLAVVRAKPAFKADLDRARTELGRLRADPAASHPQGCAAEAALIAERVMPKLDPLRR